MKWILVAAVAVVLVSCTFSFPTVGRLSNGEPVQGTIVADTSGNGTFSVATTSGFTCNGTYDSLDDSQTLRIPVTCSDGRSGIVIATRDSSLVAGTAIAEIDGGLKGEFIFGQLTAEEQAAFLARTAKRAE